MSSRSIPSNFVQNVGQNGVGRYVCQLQRVTLKFCKSYAGSRGMRDFIENHLLDFTRSNPGVVVYLKPRRHRPAVIFAEYLNGRKESIPVNNMRPEEICKWIEFARTQSGVEIVRLRKMWHTDTPSIQGVWHPFLNKDPSVNVTDFKSKDLFKFVPSEETATEVVQKLANELKKVSVISEGDAS